MVFSSLTFLFAYLPLTLLVYFAAPLRWRNLVLLVVSLIFYGWGEPVYITIMVLSTLIDYSHGLLVEKYRHNDKKARWFVAQSVIFNLLLLGFFKYGTFLAENLYLLTGIQIPQSVTVAGLTVPLLGIPLPIGISFYTFQTMSYTIDVYRRDAPVQRNMVDFGAFVTMFPQLIAGPIVRYKTVAAELNRRTHASEQFALGARRFCVGLAKKVLLANAVGKLWDECLAAQGAGTLTAAAGWLGLVAFGFQIYFDFSGYSDMAIGLGRMFGFHFEENFNYPYISQSVTEFWRRWHMSLSGWFRDYVYIPLGGSRQGRGKQVRNILIVWTLTGLWHGAAWNFLLWGLYFGLLLLGEKFLWGAVLRRGPRPLRHLYAMVIVVLGWVLFRCETLGAVGTYLQAMAGLGGGNSGQAVYFLREYWVYLLLGVVAALPVKDAVRAALERRHREGLLHWGTALLGLGVLGFSFLQLISSTVNPFIYYRF